MSRVTVFGPNPVVTVAIEPAVRESGDEIHVHAGGQGVWVARMIGELGVTPVLCGFAGGETGMLVRPALAGAPGELRLVGTAASTGCYVSDRRTGERRTVAVSWPEAPTRHEVDDLFALTCADALHSDALVVCNPLPGDALPLEIYGKLVADVRANGTPVLVDLSSPRLNSALEGEPDLVKLNDWELAQFVNGPVSEPSQWLAAFRLLRDGGARSVLLTRGGEPAIALRADGAWFELRPPRFERGSREGCGDTMMGAIAAGLASGRSWLDALILGAAAGAANFLRHDLGTSRRSVVEELVGQIKVRQLDREALPAAASAP